MRARTGASVATECDGVWLEANVSGIWQGVLAYNGYTGLESKLAYNQGFWFDVGTVLRHLVSTPPPGGVETSQHLCRRGERPSERKTKGEHLVETENLETTKHAQKYKSKHYEHCRIIPQIWHILPLRLQGHMRAILSQCFDTPP